MYGAVPPKSKVTARKPDDNTVEMQPLMVDPYFDKNFAPEVSFLSLQSILYILLEMKCPHLLLSIVSSTAKYVFIFQNSGSDFCRVYYSCRWYCRIFKRRATRDVTNRKNGPFLCQQTYENDDAKWLDPT